MVEKVRRGCCAGPLLASPPPPAAAADPVVAAKAAGLRYVHDSQPGLRRLRCGRGFRYVDPAGRTIRDRATLQRIRSLAIPPAWKNVWICPLEEGHLQATGRDDRRRKQARYHPRWRAARDATKYHRMLAFGRALPRIRARVEADLAQSGLPRTKVLATVVRLLEQTHIRVGNEEYARTNGSYGLTTLRNQHVEVQGSKVRFHFRGKSGIRHEVALQDPRLARVIRRCQDLPGHELFGYIDDHGQPRTIDSADVNAYLQEIAGEEFTAKDFRTWAGTVLAASALRACPPCSSKTKARRQVVAAVEAVAQQLGNTPAVCRKCYIHPALIEAYLDGSLPRRWHRRAKATGLDAEEAALMAFLQRLS